MNRSLPFAEIRQYLIISTLILLTGCAAGPSVRDVQTVRLELSKASDFHIDVVNVADPEARPGKLAGQMASQGMRDCSDPSAPFLSFVFAPLCAGIGAAAGATTGAVITATTTIPDEQADHLERATRSSVSRTNWHEIFLSKLEADAKLNGKTLGTNPEDVPVLVNLVELSWHISAGNSVSIHGDFEVGSRTPDGNFTFKKITVKGERHKVDSWITDGGKPIDTEFRRFLIQSSEKIWTSINGRRRDY